MITKYIWVYVMINFTLLIVSSPGSGQVRIGPDNTIAITPGAMFEVASSATVPKGFLSPRISLSDTSAWGLSGSSSDGMMVYNTNASITGGSGVGLYIFYNSRWNRMVDEAALVSLPRARVVSTVNQGGAAGGGFIQNQNTVIPHDTIDPSTTGITVSADGVKFTILTAGYYLIATSFRVGENGANSGTTVGERYLSIMKNAIYDANYYISGGSALASTGITCTGTTSLNTNVMSYLNAGDTILSNFIQTSNYTNIISDASLGTISMQVVKCSN